MTFNQLLSTLACKKNLSYNDIHMYDIENLTKKLSIRSVRYIHGAALPS